ncbi:putative histone-lysine N-methyltransferase Mes-4 [Pseudolycoriella hygida]|uniref:Histone-lysine N-methyltransferase Mes-4 n=1 Tax=Pseudolycoriella hygida TaxID=35572 RepID=A0A9Q0S171_9DIPT|nr:putative histone-lysine N-methyltransferase Mes-4 [Pseudolycoriella hygida]
MLHANSLVLLSLYMQIVSKWLDLWLNDKFVLLRENQRKGTRQRNNQWVELENVFEFNGHESFLAKSLTMKSILSKTDYKKAFDTSNYDEWHYALAEATLLMKEEPKIRLIYLDLFKMRDHLNCELGKIVSNIVSHKTDLGAQSSAEARPVAQPGAEARPVAQSSAEARPVAQSSAEARPVAQSSAEARPVAQTTVPKNGEHSEPPVTRKAFQRLSINQLNVQVKEIQTTGGKVRRHSDSYQQVKQRGSAETELSIKKQTRSAKFKEDLLMYQTYPVDKFLEGIPRGNVCKICWSVSRHASDLIKCSDCGDHVHGTCLHNNNDESYVLLSDLSVLEPPKSVIKIRLNLCNDCPLSQFCYVCKKETAAQLIQCGVKSCGRYYHSECLITWKQTTFTDSKLNCPLHVCHTCVSKNKDRQQFMKKFAHCVKCPTTYHFEAWCIPPGTKILSRHRIICVRHRSISSEELRSIDWCFHCGKEGDVMLTCGACPKSYHTACLNVTEITHPFLCESCAIGSNPMYGEMVIAKYLNHPWWPAVIVPPFAIPQELIKPGTNDHKFCIRFFGTFNYGWTGRNSVFLYSKEQASRLMNTDAALSRALVQAAKWFDEMQKANRYKMESKKSETETQRKLSSYIKISAVNPVPPAKLMKTKDEPCLCACSPDDIDPCGPTSKCENRLMNVECNPKTCPSASKCKNLCFERKMFPSVKAIFVSEEKGFGLIADEFISAGTLVIEYVGELITEAEFQQRYNRKESHSGIQHYYFMDYSKGLYIDADQKGNLSRFINHSCDPNCASERWIVSRVQRIGIVALKNIEKGTEITMNYGFSAGGRRHQCFCGEKKCRGAISR